MHKFKGLSFDDSRGDGTVKLRNVDELEDDPSAPSSGMEHIDWILLDNSDSGKSSFIPKSTQIIVDAFSSGRYPSDHFPVRADLLLTRCE